MKLLGLSSPSARVPAGMSVRFTQEVGLLSRVPLEVGRAVDATLTIIAIKKMNKAIKRSACRTSIPISQIIANVHTPMTSMFLISKLPPIFQEFLVTPS